MVDRGDLLPGTRVYMMYPELYPEQDKEQSSSVSRFEDHF